MGSMNGREDVGVFQNDDRRLRAEAEQVVAARSAAGLDGLVGDLAAVIVRVEADRLRAAAEELLRYTGYAFADAFEDADAATCVLTRPGSADIVLRSRKRGANPFAEINRAPKTSHLPNTRLETFVFEVRDIEAYAAIQQGRGVRFATPGIRRFDHCAYIRTEPSRYTGNATGFIQWTGARGVYRTAGAADLGWRLQKPDLGHLKNIGILDHAATRVVAEHRDPAILEFMALTNYRFEFALYVPDLNSITNVSRLPNAAFAMVFTSGIRPYISEEVSGPTERYVQNYGARVHHLAFCTEAIDATYDALCRDGMAFLSGLVGGPDQGLKQAFTVGSPHTFLVIEYILRYGDFTGFFTQDNVARLTEATGKQ